MDVAAGPDDDGWLARDGQRVLEVVAGPVAAEQVGDDLGSRVVAARLAGVVLQRGTGLPTGARATGPCWDRPFRGVLDEVEQLLLAE